MSLRLSVKEAHKVLEPDKHYVFVVAVAGGKGNHVVYRRYNEFHEMHRGLMRHFPELAGRLPILPGKVILLPGQKMGQLAASRVPELDAYLREISAIPALLSSAPLQGFIEWTGQDAELELKLQRSKPCLRAPTGLTPSHIGPPTDFRVDASYTRNPSTSPEQDLGEEEDHRKVIFDAQGSSSEARWRAYPGSPLGPGPTHEQVVDPKAPSSAFYTQRNQPPGGARTPPPPPLFPPPPKKGPPPPKPPRDDLPQTSSAPTPIPTPTMLLPGDFAHQRRHALLTGGEGGEANRTGRARFYARMIDEAEAAGQISLARAILLLKMKGLEGEAELAEWDSLLAKFSACLA